MCITEPKRSHHMLLIAVTVVPLVILTLFACVMYYQKNYKQPGKYSQAKIKYKSQKNILICSYLCVCTFIKCLIIIKTVETCDEEMHYAETTFAAYQLQSMVKYCCTTIWTLHVFSMYTPLASLNSCSLWCVWGFYHSLVGIRAVILLPFTFILQYGLCFRTILI